MTTLNKIRRVWARPAGSGCMAEAGGAGGDGSPGGGEARAGAAPRAHGAPVKAASLGSAGPTSADIGSSEKPSWAPHTGLGSRSEPQNTYGDTTRHLSRCTAISALPEGLLAQTRLCEGSRAHSRSSPRCRKERAQVGSACRPPGATVGGEGEDGVLTHAQPGNRPGRK